MSYDGRTPAELLEHARDRRKAFEIDYERWEEADEKEREEMFARDVIALYRYGGREYCRGVQDALACARAAVRKACGDDRELFDRMDEAFGFGRMKSREAYAALVAAIAFERDCSLESALTLRNKLNALIDSEDR